MSTAEPVSAAVSSPVPAAEVALSSASSALSSPSVKESSIAPASPERSRDIEMPDSSFRASATDAIDNATSSASIKNLIDTSNSNTNSAVTENNSFKNAKEKSTSPVPSSTTPPKRRRPPMLALNGNQKLSSSPNNTNYANVNLTSHNKNSATATTTLSATPSSSIFPSIRTPKDVVLQDLALQCISPGLPTFPSVIRDAMAKSKSIQEEQRKIIAQRMKGNGGSFSQVPLSSDSRISVDSDGDIDLEADSVKLRDNFKSSSNSMIKTPGIHAESNGDTNSPEIGEDKDSEKNKLSEKTKSVGNAKADLSSSNNANLETRLSTNGNSTTLTNNSSNESDTIPVTIDRSSKTASLQEEQGDVSKTQNGSAGNSLELPGKQIIKSGGIIIEAVPTPTLSSHPNFTQKDYSSRKCSTKRAPPPKSIKISGFDSQNPSIRSAPLNKNPAPFSPYSISKLPGYQAFYLNQALATQKDGANSNDQQSKKQTQGTGLNNVSSSTGQASSKNFIPRHSLPHSTAGPQTASLNPHSAYGMPLMSPIYPPSGSFSYTRPPTVSSNPYYYTRHPSQHHLLTTPGQYPGLNKANGVSAALRAPVNGLQPGLTSTAASNFYRDPKMVPLYVSGRPTIPPMTASAAHWTGRTFRSHQFNKRQDDGDDDDENDEDDGRDPEDAALSDDETDEPKKSKASKRSSSEQNDDDDDLDDVEQKAISEEDELPSQNKKRRVGHTPTAPILKKPLTNGDMYDIASGVFKGPGGIPAPPLSAVGNGSSMAFNNPYYENVRNMQSQMEASMKHLISIGNKTEEQIQDDLYRKQRFTELCSEIWDLMRS